MKKKIISLIIILILSGGSFWLYGNIAEKEIKKYIYLDMKVDFPGKFKNTEIVRCNIFDIFSPEYAFVGEYNDNQNSKKVFFYKIKKENIFSNQNLSDEYIGGTTVKNTTFNNLLKMVKEDCCQFQKSGSVGIKQDSMQWIYSKAESKEKKEQRRKRKEEREKKEREEWNKLSEKEKQKILEENKKVDEFMNLSDEEKLKIIEEKFSD